MDLGAMAVKGYSAFPKAPPSDYLVACSGHTLLAVSYPSAKMQSVYSTDQAPTPTSRATIFWQSDLADCRGPCKPSTVINCALNFHIRNAFGFWRGVMAQIELGNCNFPLQVYLWGFQNAQRVSAPTITILPTITSTTIVEQLYTHFKLAHSTKPLSYLSIMLICNTTDRLPIFPR